MYRNARNTLKLGQFFLCIAGLLCANLAEAESISDAKKMMSEGRLSDALLVTDRMLQKQPADPSILFVRGLILSEQHKSAEAIEIFSRLTVAHPDFPEPYNNLAVLFANEGQYTKARVALEAALKINPRYATAQENLGDIYMQAALQAYLQAQTLAVASPGLRSKLDIVRTSLGAAPGAATSVTKLPSSKMQVAATAATIRQVAVTGPVVANSAAAVRAEDKAILKLVDDWAAAWRANDFNSYLSFYAEDFQPPPGQTRKSWEALRKSRVANKRPIALQVLAPKVNVGATGATVDFQQIYASGKVTSDASKHLSLKLRGGKWLIYKEESDG
jgi:Flp pilus assembly protein TadD